MKYILFRKHSYTGCIKTFGRKITPLIYDMDLKYIL